MSKISTSILSSKDRIDSIKKLNITNTDYIHIDAMDNIFVPNYQMPLDEVNEFGKYSHKPFDIHLMLNNPEPYIKGLTIPNIDSITIHVEIEKDIKYLIDLIKSYGYKAGLAIKPQTNISTLKEYANYIDKVIIMSVEPGFGGQKFIENTINTIMEIKKNYPHIKIEVDGGIDDIIYKRIASSIDIAVIGSYITSKENYQKAINNLKN